MPYRVAVALLLGLPLFASAAQCDSVSVTFRLRDASAQPLHVNGDQDVLGQWAPVAQNRMTAGPDGVSTLTVALPPARYVQYKFVRGEGPALVWESHATTYSHNRQFRTPDCGAAPLVLDVATFRDAPGVQESELADAPFKDGPPTGGKQGERLRALAAAINAHTPQAVERFLVAHTTEAFRAAVPPEMHAGAFDLAWQHTHGVTLSGVRHYAKPVASTAVLMADRLYGKGMLAVSFDGTPEERIDGIELIDGRAFVNGPVSEAKGVAEIRATVERLCKADVFSGAVLVAHGKRTLLETACGEASKRYHVRNGVDTRFNLGSMNKMFTAVAILQLADQKRLGLDDTIDKYVDESWLPRAITSQVTIRQLLSHTSGLGSYFNDTFFKSSRDQYRELADYKPLLAGEKLKFKPGTRFSYSNTGMLLLGAVIEKVSGKDYFDYVRQFVYRPAGMTRSDSYAMDDPVPDLAMGYIRDPKAPLGWRENNFMHVLRGGPAGGGYSTVRDLRAFAAALEEGRLVPKALLAKAWTKASDTSYGYGFVTDTGRAGHVVGHTGGFPGIGVELDMYLDRGYTVASLSNYDDAGPMLAGRIREILSQVR